MKKGLKALKSIQIKRCGTRTIKKWVDLNAQGYTIKEISAAYHKSTAEVGTAVREYREAEFRRTHPSFYGIDMGKVKALKDAGWSYYYIGLEFNKTAEEMEQIEKDYVEAGEPFCLEA